ncbi:MAG: carbamate kinase [Candidatus Brocadiia bacterium]
MSKRIVVALGGNAIIRQGENPTVYTQFRNTREALRPIVELVRDGHRIVITHGNGPQVGQILIRSEMASAKAYELPLGVCVAQSQGEMGYMIAQCMKNMLVHAGINDKEAVTIITQVIVDPKDPAMANPTKPIGPFMDEARGRALAAQGTVVREDAGRGWRRVVASPYPYSVYERKAILDLIDDGFIVVAVGGGGCPIYFEKDGTLEGVDAVVDKDLASMILAREIGAEVLIISTGVPFVYLNFGKPEQVKVEHATAAQMRAWLAEGHFAKGSMEPKIRAAVEFIEGGGEEVIITLPEQVTEAFKGNTGTHITAK